MYVETSVEIAKVAMQTMPITDIHPASFKIAIQEATRCRVIWFSPQKPSELSAAAASAFRGLFPCHAFWICAGGRGAIYRR